jgi:hypothetical protein
LTEVGIDEQLSPVRIAAADMLLPAVTDQACLPRRRPGGYKGFDALKSRLAQGERGVLVHRYPGSHT